MSLLVEIETASRSAIEQAVSLVKKARQCARDIGTQLGPMAIKAAETDPEKRIYGDAMSAKVLQLQRDFEIALEKLESFEACLAGDVALLEENARIERQQQKKELDEKAHREEEAKKALQRVEDEKIARAKAEAERVEALKKQAEEERIRQERIEYEKRKLEKEKEAVLAQALLKEKQATMDRFKTLETREALNFLESLCGEILSRKVFKALLDILSNLIQHPEDPKFRHLRKENESVKRRFLVFEADLERKYY